MKRNLIGALVVFSSLLVCTPTSAALHIFLKFDGIDGESTAQGHEKWIDVDSYSFNGSSFCCGFTSFFPGVNIGKHLDVATPKLFQDMATSAQIPSATLDVINDSPGPQPLFEYFFGGVTINSQNFTGDAKGSAVEAITFNFSTAKLTDFPIDSNGHPLPPVTGEWNGFSFNFEPVPEPSTYLFVCFGALFALVRRFQIFAVR